MYKPAQAPEKVSEDASGAVVYQHPAFAQACLSISRGPSTLMHGEGDRPHTKRYTLVVREGQLIVDPAQGRMSTDSRGAIYAVEFTQSQLIELMAAHGGEVPCTLTLREGELVAGISEQDVDPIQLARERIAQQAARVFENVVTQAEEALNDLQHGRISKPRLREVLNTIVSSRQAMRNQVEYAIDQAARVIDERLSTRRADSALSSDEADPATVAANGAASTPDPALKPV